MAKLFNIHQPKGEDICPDILRGRVLIVMRDIGLFIADARKGGGIDSEVVERVRGRLLRPDDKGCFIGAESEEIESVLGGLSWSPNSFFKIDSS